MHVPQPQIRLYFAGKAHHWKKVLCPQKINHKGRKQLSSILRSSQWRYSSIKLANILKTLKHENIVTCFRMLKTSSNLYIVYSYLEGNSLEEVLELGPKVMTLAQSTPFPTQKKQSPSNYV